MVKWYNGCLPSNSRGFDYPWPHKLRKIRVFPWSFSILLGNRKSFWDILEFTNKISKRYTASVKTAITPGRTQKPPKGAFVWPGAKHLHALRGNRNRRSDAGGKRGVTRGSYERSEFETVRFRLPLVFNNFAWVIERAFVLDYELQRNNLAKRCTAAVRRRLPLAASIPQPDSSVSHGTSRPSTSPVPVPGWVVNR